MKIFLAFLFAIFVLFISLLPFRLLYLFSDLMYYLLYYLFKYRRAVVQKNLKESFPEKSNKEIERLTKLSYKNLTDVIIEGLKAFTMTKKQIKARHMIVNPEVIEQYIELGKGVIAAPCHYGNWEWGSLSPSLFFSPQIIVFYKPINNPYINRFVNKNRSRTGGVLTSIYQTSDTFKRLKHQKAIYVMAADQSPSNIERAIWVNFLGRETAFLHGLEFYGKTYNYPVVFADIKRVKRGYYELTLSVISEKSSETPSGEITRRYAEELESAIRRKPEDYLWSHKRWKHQK